MDTLSGFKSSVPKIKNVNTSQLSAKIYKPQSHERRAQMMKHQLMEVYDNWEGKRNLFKYVANHLGKAESFLDVITSETL